LSPIEYRRWSCTAVAGRESYDVEVVVVENFSGRENSANEALSAATAIATATATPSVFSMTLLSPSNRS